MKPIVLRTKLSYSIFSLLNLVVIVSLMLAIVALVRSIPWRIALLGLTYLAVLIFIDRTLLRLRRNKIILDARGIHSSQGGLQVQVDWNEIEAVWQPEAVAKIGIFRVTTPTGPRQIYLGTFDKARTWDVIRQYVPPAALKAEAYKEIDSYSEFRSVLHELFTDYSFPLETTHSGARLIGWIGLVTLGTLSVIFARAGFWFFVPLYAFSALISLVYLLAVGRTKLDFEGVTHLAWFGRYSIRWSEIREIESSPLDTWMVLHGKGKKMALPGIRLWSGIDRGRMLSLYMYILAENAVLQRETQWADFKLRNAGTRQHPGSQASPDDSSGDQT